MTPVAAGGLVAVCTYQVAAGQERRFERLLERHVPTLRRLGLVTGLPSCALRSTRDGDPVYVEVFEWASPDAAGRAAEVPEVIEVWEPMAALCESRDGLPGLDFPLFDLVRADE